MLPPLRLCASAVNLKTLALVSLCLFALSARAEFTIAAHSKARCVIVRQEGATAPEKKAAEELAATLEQITGANFEMVDATTNVPAHAIIVGQGRVAAQIFPEIDFARLGEEEIILRVKG